MTKPKKRSTKASPSPDRLPGGQHRQTMELLANDIRRMYLAHLAAPPGHVPANELLDAIESLVIHLGDNAFSDCWTRRDWKCMAASVQFAEQVRAEQRDLRERLPSEAFWSKLEKLLDLCESITNPQPLPGPKVVRLETLPELIEQKVSPGQICKIYGWVDPKGEPILDKFNAAKAGELDPPETAVYSSGDPEQPATRPHMGTVESLASQMVAARECEPAAV